MIEQVLNRRFVLEQLQLVAAKLSEPVSDRRGIGNEILADNQLRDFASGELGSALEREVIGTSGQNGYDRWGQDRRGESPPPMDDTVFISHDPIISILQSALTEYFEHPNNVHLLKVEI